MDSEYKRAMRLVHLQLRAGVHVIQLAQLASAFDALIESGRMLERTGVPGEELTEVPDVDELVEKEADMPLGQVAQILADFFQMSAEGQARLEVMLGLGEDD